MSADMGPRNRRSTIERLRSDIRERDEELGMLIAVADALRDARFADSDEAFTAALDEAFDALEEYDLRPQPCTDCGVDTLAVTPAEDSEYYMVHAAIWRMATKTRPAYLLCVGCLETRIGRQLTSADFTDAPVNDPNKESMSDRLRSRMLTPASAV